MYLLYQYSPATICFFRGDPRARKVNPVTNELTRKLAMRFMLPECYQGQCQVNYRYS